MKGSDVENIASVVAIPRVIHYCWFGGKPLPAEAERCIASWRLHLPDCRIVRHDESNFDVNKIPFTAEAAQRGMWAFVSDYARFDILYREGGIYFDTDVEVIAPIDDILATGSFMGWEKTATSLGVNAGLGMAACAGMQFYEEVLADYAGRHFVDSKGNRVPGTVVTAVTRLLRARGLEMTDTMQRVAGIDIYPSTYFSPLDDLTGKLHITSSTRSIHHYAKTWIEAPAWRTRLSRWSHRLFGLSATARLKNMLNIQ